MKELMEFLLERMDYEDEQLVETVYAMYEQLEKAGEVYLQKNVFEDVAQLSMLESDEESVSGDDVMPAETYELPEKTEKNVIHVQTLPKREKLSLWKRLSGKRSKEKESESAYYETFPDRMAGCAVAEEPEYDEGYGSTVYVEQTVDEEKEHKLYTPDGRVAGTLDAESFLIGKQKEEVNLLLEDESVIGRDNAKRIVRISVRPYRRLRVILKL